MAGALQGMGHFSGTGLGSRGRRSKASRLGPGHSRKAGFPGGWVWENFVDTGCGGAGECVSPLIVGLGGGFACQLSDPLAV